MTTSLHRRRNELGYYHLPSRAVKKIVADMVARGEGRAAIEARLKAEGLDPDRIPFYLPAPSSSEETP